MSKSQNNLLTQNEFIFILVGIILGLNVLSMPSTVVSDAHQDGWIASLLGAAYPLYLILMTAIIIRKYPGTSIMDLSTNYLGRFLGNLLNFLFMCQFLCYEVLITSAAITLLMTYAVWFMTPLKIVVILVILSVYATTKGLKVLGRINIIVFASMSIILFATATGLKYGSLTNLQPVFGAGFVKIAKATKDSAFAYAGMEIILIINPYIKDKSKIIKSGLIATAIVSLFYFWIVFTSTVYLGPDIVPKAFWPAVFVSESVKIPVINNFRFVLMLIWPLIIVKSISNTHFVSVSIMNSIFGINFKKWCIIFSPIILIVPLLIENELIRRSFADLIIPWMTIFNLSYFTLIAILTAFKGNKSKKSI